MTKINLDELTVSALLSLRGDIDKRLVKLRQDLETQLKLFGISNEKGSGIASQSKRRGRKPGQKLARKSGPGKSGKVAPKYRGPSGETWAGRGLKPKWLTSLIKEGHRIEDFAVN